MQLVKEKCPVARIAAVQQPRKIDSCNIDARAAETVEKRLITAVITGGPPVKVKRDGVYPCPEYVLVAKLIDSLPAARPRRLRRLFGSLWRHTLRHEKPYGCLETGLISPAIAAFCHSAKAPHPLVAIGR